MRGNRPMSIFELPIIASFAKFNCFGAATYPHYVWKSEKPPVYNTVANQLCSFLRNRS